MANKYYDVNSVMQVIGGVFTHPTIIDEEDKYSFISEDFSVEFHRIIFGSIYNLYKLGATHITPVLIEDYLSAKPDKLATYKANKGSEYLQKLVEFTQFSAFDYYYKRMKKMTLLRMYYNAGVDISEYYDDSNILDVKRNNRKKSGLITLN